MLRILNVTLSRCTVLSRLMRIPLPPLSTPRVLDVDDFALYGGTYGTLLVEATTRLPLTLWEGRDAEQLSRRLRTHPGVEVACRDGSITYRSLQQRAGALAGIAGAPREDRHAVAQGINTYCNSGVNEGRITDVKLQERLMAGRASAPLLRHCVVLIAHLRRHYAGRATPAPR